MWLIDADALFKAFEKNAWYNNMDRDEIAEEILLQMPTIDAAPVVHGRWREADDGDGAVCSVCGEDFCNIYLEIDRFKYCPNCGAKMKEGDINEG